jgi:hypothetical protein
MEMELKHAVLGQISLSALHRSGNQAAGLHMAASSSA